MQKPIDPPKPTHFALTAKVIIFSHFYLPQLGFTREEAREKITGIYEGLGLDAKVHLDYNHHDKEFAVRAIADGECELPDPFRFADYDKYNQFYPESEARNFITDHLREHDIYDWSIEILDTQKEDV